MGRLEQVPLQTGIPVEWIPARKPELFAGRHEGRLAKPLGLTQFGVDWLQLDPGAHSALRHWHEREDEFVYVLSGELVLVDDDGEHEMKAGSFAAFPAGEANGHHLINRSLAPATYLAVGSRRADDLLHYPDDGFSIDKAANRMSPLRR
jgi:uncharacterized cupin superfamily protein